jgi:hypothetical protein
MRHHGRSEGSSRGASKYPAPPRALYAILRPLLFAGEGFCPGASSFVRFPSRLEGWRDLLVSTIPFLSLVRCPAFHALSVRLLPPLFGVLIHRTSSSTRASQRPPEPPVFECSRLGDPSFRGTRPLPVHHVSLLFSLLPKCRAPLPKAPRPSADCDPERNDSRKTEPLGRWASRTRGGAASRSGALVLVMCGTMLVAPSLYL